MNNHILISFLTIKLEPCTISTQEFPISPRFDNSTLTLPIPLP
jgi:hypothetical protein